MLALPTGLRLTGSIGNSFIANVCVIVWCIYMCQVCVGMAAVTVSDGGHTVSDMYGVSAAPTQCPDRSTLSTDHQPTPYHR